MKCKLHILVLVFLTALSLILASMAVKEQLEEVFADDYDTYVHPGFGSNFTVQLQLGDKDALLFVSVVTAIFFSIPACLRTEFFHRILVYPLKYRKLFLFCCTFLL